MFNFDEAIDRTASNSQKWEKYKGQDILPLWVADCDFGVAPAITQAMTERLAHPVFGYTNTPASLVSAFQQHLTQHFDWQVEGDEMIWLPGLVCGLHLACKAASREGETVICPTPIYPPFMTAPVFNQRKLTKVPMALTGQRWTIDLKALEASITPDTRVILFCNPHNPGGTVYTREELTALAEIVIKHDLVICSDEIHCDLVLEPSCQHIPLATISPEIAERTITLMAPSKTFNIAGLGCATAIITNPTLRKRFARARRGIVADVNIMGYVAAEAAYTSGQEWLAEQLDYLRENRDLLLEAAKQWPEFSFNPIEATYLAWFEVKDQSIRDPEAFFLNAGVGLSSGKDFGNERFMRLNFGCTRATLKEAIARINSALEAYRNA